MHTYHERHTWIVYAFCIPLAVSLVTSGGSAPSSSALTYFSATEQSSLFSFTFALRYSLLRIPGWPQTEGLSASAYQVVGLEVCIVWLFSTVFKYAVQCYSMYSHCCEVVTVILYLDPSCLVQPTVFIRPQLSTHCGTSSSAAPVPPFQNLMHVGPTTFILCHWLLLLKIQDCMCKSHLKIHPCHVMCKTVCFSLKVEYYSIVSCTT